MRLAGLLLAAVVALPLRAQLYDLHGRTRLAVARVPRSSIVEIGELDQFSTGAPPVLSIVKDVLGMPMAQSDAPESLPRCPGDGDGDGADVRGYRLVVGPLLQEVDRSVLVLGRACKKLEAGRVKPWVRETFVTFHAGDDEKWKVSGVEQRWPREATQPVVLTRSILGDVWSIAFSVLAAAAAITLLLTRHRLANVRWNETLLVPNEPRWWRSPIVRPDEAPTALPLVAGWAVALTLGCVWLLIAALSVPEGWTLKLALITTLEVSGGACTLSTLHTLSLRPLPYRGPLISAAMGALVGWLAGTAAQSIPGMTMSGAVVGGTLYGGLVGVSGLFRRKGGVRQEEGRLSS